MFSRIAKLLLLPLLVVVMTTGGVIAIQQQKSTTTTTPVKIIVDTDIGQYPDDVGALTILHSFADQGLVHWEAIVADNRYEGIVAVIDAMNHYFNRSGIPIGITKDPEAFAADPKENIWGMWMIDNFPHPKYQHNSQAEDAVTLYRKVLASNPDNSITIVSLGHFTNLANLLRTGGDRYSKLTGVELVHKKVKNMVAMAGVYPSGDEWNIMKDIKSAQLVAQQWNVPTVFVGFEVGQNIFCGRNLINNLKFTHSPIAHAFQIEDESEGCFDEVAAYIAIKGVEPFYREIGGTIEIFQNGTNVWNYSKYSNRAAMSYVEQIESNRTIVDAINILLQR